MGVKPVFESEKTDGILGWRVFRLNESDISKTVSSNSERKIIQEKNGNLVYSIDFPELSFDDARLLKDALEE